MTIAHKNTQDYEMDRILNSPEARIVAEKIVGCNVTLSMDQVNDKIIGKCIAAEPHRIDQEWHCFSPSQELTFKLTMELEDGTVKDFFVGNQQIL